MSDMSAVIIPKSDQLNSDDLISGPITIRIAGVSIRPGGGEQPISVHYDGDNGKPYKPCKSMCRVMVAAWGADSKQYTGRSMTLYRDPTVKWAGMDVGGIRISHMTDIPAPLTMALTMTKQSRKPFTVKPLEPTAPEDPSIDGEQEKRVRELLAEHSVPEGALLEFGGWEDLKRDMPARLFNSVCNWIADKNGVRTKPKTKS